MAREEPEIDNDNRKGGGEGWGKFEHSWDQSESLKLPLIRTSNGQQELK